MLAVTTLESTPQDTAVEADLLASQSVEWLVCVANDRDRLAFEKLYEHFAPKVKSYLQRQGADPATADDLAQETMAQVWRKATQYEASRAAPGAWIFRIARNLRIDRLRRQRFHEVDLTETAEIADDGMDSHTRSTDRIDASRLPAMVRELPAEQFEVIQLAYFEGMTQSEIGERLELPLGTVKSRMRLAFGKLRAAIGEQS